MVAGEAGEAGDKLSLSPPLPKENIQFSAVATKSGLFLWASCIECLLESPQTVTFLNRLLFTLRASPKKTV